jgi:sugar lactone lactonase YvrE
VGIDARFYGPSGVAVDSMDNVYVSDQVNHTIRRVTPTGAVTTLAGLAGYGGSADGTGSDVRFNAPTGVAVDNAGNLYAADTWNCTIRKATPARVVTTLAGQAGTIGSANGTGSNSQFALPNSVAVDGACNIYVADTLFDTIRKVTPVGTNWEVSTLAGLPDVAGSANGVGANARFNFPCGVALDGATNLYVADTGNHTIRKITPVHAVTTVAGLAGVAGSTDGTGDVARFNFPSGVAVDGAANVYVADTYNNTIRKLTLSGTNWVVTTLGGTPGIWGSADGRGSAARFSNPNSLAVDSAGNLYVADFYLNTIRKGSPPSLILNPGLTNGQFSFVLTGPAGQSVVVEYSTDLLTWLPLWTNTFMGALNFTDPQSGAFSNRFYRARLP